MTATLPDWALALVDAVEHFENVHGQPSFCLAGALDQVPAEVRAEARGYARAKRLQQLDDAETALLARALTGEYEAAAAIVRVLGARARLLGLEDQPSWAHGPRPGCCVHHGFVCAPGNGQCCGSCPEAFHAAPGHGGTPCSNLDDQPEEQATLSQPDRPYAPGTRLTLTCTCSDGPAHFRGISRCLDRDEQLRLEPTGDGGTCLVVEATP
jgi:hypothetical protein